LLEQTLWTVANIVLESPKVIVKALEIHIDFCIGLIMHSYGQHFTAQVWRVTIWLLSSLSTGLAYMSKPVHDVYNQFLTINLNRAYNMVLQDLD